MSAVPAWIRGPGAWCVACAALAIAMGLPPLPLQRDVLDFIAVVDITQSMNTLDATLDGEPVSRLAMVKAALARAVPQLPCGSRMGLGVFTEYRTLLLFAPVEVCVDRREILDSIVHLNGQMAWAGDSQIAKGVYSALRTAQDLPTMPAIVFITDGQEAPPINARHRAQFDGDLAAAKGLLVGVGGAQPSPIPKVDPDGRPLGVWGATEVLQADLYANGRQGSADHEAMAESEPETPVPFALRGSPGAEHLSYLREDYLKLLAAETHLGYRRLGAAVDMVTAMHTPFVTRRRNAPTDLRWIAGIVALFAMGVRYAGRSL